MVTFPEKQPGFDIWTILLFAPQPIRRVLPPSRLREENPLAITSPMGHMAKEGDPITSAR
jgi:hypothetical protein